MQNQFVKDYLEFHRKFDFDLPEHFRIPDEEVISVRLNFLLEELKETASALGYTLDIVNASFKFIKAGEVQNPANAVDGLVDLMYVVLGTAAFMGILNDRGIEGITTFELAWKMVHEANMKKVKVESADESTRGTKIDVKKPKGWQPPNLEGFVK